jgi:hypothetical protein
VEGEFRRGGLVGPIVLIGLGVVFLLDNLGVLDLSVWDVIVRTWPIILIAWGADLLIVRRTAEATLLTLALLLVILVGGVWILGVQGVGTAAPRVEAVEQPMGSATRMEIQLRPAVGVLRIHDLADPDVMLSGTFGLSRGQEVEREFDQRGSLATLQLASSRGWFIPGPGSQGDQVGESEWRLGVNPNFPLTLEIESGVGKLELDLTSFDLEELNLDLGLGLVEIRLPLEGTFTANVSVAIGLVEIVVPKDLALKVHLDTAITVREQVGFRKRGDLYLSPAAINVSDAAELFIHQPIGRVLLTLE